MNDVILIRGRPESGKTRKAQELTTGRITCRLSVEEFLTSKFTPFAANTQALILEDLDTTPAADRRGRQLRNREPQLEPMKERMLADVWTRYDRGQPSSTYLRPLVIVTTTDRLYHPSWATQVIDMTRVKP